MKRTIFAILALPALCITLTLGASVAHADAASVKVSCFPARAWSAVDSQRPCTTVTAPDNDQVRVIQGTATRELAECVIDTAEIGDAQCHRVAGNRAAPDDVAPTLGHASAQAVCTYVLHLCAAVFVPQEDGSGLVTVYDYKRHPMRAFITCILSNPTEESGRYSIPCHA